MGQQGPDTHPEFVVLSACGEHFTVGAKLDAPDIMISFFRNIPVLENARFGKWFVGTIQKEISRYHIFAPD